MADQPEEVTPPQAYRERIVELRLRIAELTDESLRLEDEIQRLLSEAANPTKGEPS